MITKLIRVRILVVTVSVVLGARSLRRTVLRPVVTTSWTVLTFSRTVALFRYPVLPPSASLVAVVLRVRLVRVAVRFGTTFMLRVRISVRVVKGPWGPTIRSSPLRGLVVVGGRTGMIVRLFAFKDGCIDKAVP